MINKHSHAFMKKWILLWSCIFTLCVVWSSPTYALDDCLSKCQENDDKDNDGLSDNFENCLAMKHAPVLYLPADLLQYTWSKHRWPTNVEWYLRRASMKFNHDNGCRDCSVVDNFPWDASSAFDTLISQHHKYRSDWPWCEHQEPIIYSDITKQPHGREHHHFFLQLLRDTHHRGSNDPSDWNVYVHSYPTGQGVDIEYWFFYAYNDNFATSNHEGDWEHITVRLDQNLEVFEVLFYAHGDPDKKNADEVQWLDGNKGGHPLVWVAIGSHASYYRDGDECNNNWKEGYDRSCQTKDEYRWFTWSGGRADRPGYQGYGLVQVGETMYPLNGQTWIKYSGRWGEVGEIGTTSGPGGPSSKWGENQVGKDAIPSNWITGYKSCGKNRGRSPWLPQAFAH